MATLLPPPKRVKVYHGVPEPEPEVPRPSPNIVVQFVSEDDGKPLAPAVNLPANVSREGLEALVNKLSTQVRNFCDQVGVLPVKTFMMSG
jgi:ribosome assembly protein 4